MRRAAAALGILLGLLAQRAHAEDAEDAEIVIVGQKSARPPRDATLAASRIDESELSRPGASAASVLSHEPGLQVAATGAPSELATASVRGATSAQTPVYLAGIRLNDDITGTADLSLVPLWMLSRAEIYRGGAPDDADRMGIGGAVYFEPRTPRRTRLGVAASVGSFGEASLAATGEVAHGRSGALVSFRRSGATNDYPYLNDGGTVDPRDDRSIDRQNADYTATDAWAIGRTELGQRGARVTTVFNAFDREQGVSGLSAVPALSARSETARVLAGVSAKLPCSSDPSCELELVTQGISARSRLSDPKRELGLLVDHVDSAGARVGEGARLVYSFDFLRLLAGANYEFEQLALDGAGAVRSTRSTSSARVGATYAPVRRLLFSALGVLSCDRTDGPRQSAGCAESAPEWRFGGAWLLNALELRMNVARAARVPTLGELYGLSALVRGSSALVPEAGISADAGARVELPLGEIKASLSSFVFLRRVDELIAYRRSSLGAITPYNVGRARMLGAEFEAGAAWHRHVRSSLSLSLLDPRDTTPTRTLINDLVPYQSRLVASAFVAGGFDVHSAIIRRIDLDARYSYRGSRLADPAGLIVLPATSVVDVGASLAIRRELSLRGAIDDLFDDRHFDFVGYPVPGRSYHVSAEAWW